MKSRARSTANLLVSMPEYRTCVCGWFGTAPLGKLRLKVGPRFAADLRAVTPAMARSCSGLLKSFFDVGLESGVVQTSKLEQAVLAELADNALLRGDETDVDALACKFATHVQSLLALLRAMKWEEANCTSPRQCPKSGGQETPRSRCLGDAQALAGGNATQWRRNHSWHGGQGRRFWCQRGAEWALVVFFYRLHG